MPRRLIDARQHESQGDIKIVHLATQARHRYVSLSYASDSALVGHWENRILATDEHADAEVLPKIFHDAILVTRTLGIEVSLD